DDRKRTRKRSEVRDDVAEVTAAFANADGGVLVLGVEDDGKVTGHRYPQDAVEDILAVPTRRLAPRLERGVRATVDGVEVLVFVVETSPVPVMVEGDGYPCRVGDKIVRMPADRIAAWKERGLVESWEARRSDLVVSDLDPALLARAIAGSSLKDPSVEQYLLQRHLADLQGTTTLVLRRAAELLFTRVPYRIDHPNAGVRLFRVIGTERKLGVHHNVEEVPRFEGNVPTVIEALFHTIQGLLRRPQRLRGLLFEEGQEYPTFAWQEAIINALAHRDYATMGRAVEVWLYDDHLEVTNPGGLVARISLEALVSGERAHMSRNPRLVRGLVDLGLMREQGEGLPRMFAEMEVQFLAPPELRAGPHEICVTLRNAPTLT
ncbi:MAG: putative DNA binding domain-containing protein, partial [Candidatus Rokubacteria bacterium]|nr:putative DNA binding domain-containing protein [Candidatus Rokubacteria bacterium]